MLGGRTRLPVLAEISGAAREDARVWSLRRDDLQALSGLLGALEEQRCLLVTGEDGPALTVAVAAAGAACAGGRRTVLLECEMEAPRLAADLGFAPTPGLHEYLRWEATSAEILRPLALAGPAASGAGEALVCIAAGRQAPDPATLLGLGSFRHMATKLRSAYDLVVVTGPAIPSDPAALEAVAEQADAVLVATSARRSSGRDGRALRKAVGRLSAPALGSVVVGAGE
jgi:Mrp family chromosome partitioning ATPase